MSPSLSQIFSFTLHLALAAYLLNSSAEMKPIDEGQGLVLELQDGDIPLGKTPLPTKKIEPLILLPKKVVEKKVEKTKPLPKKEVVALPVKKQEVKTPVKQEDVPKDIITALPEKAKPAQKVVTQEDESFAKVVVPEEPKPVANIDEAKTAKKPMAAATTTTGNDAKAQKEKNGAVATTLPTKTEKAQNSEEPILAQKITKPSKLVVADSKNTVDTYGAVTGIRDARKLKQHPGNRRPEYPVPDRLNRRQGKVVLLAYVTDQGKVEKVQVESAKATRMMTQEAVSAFSRYRFFKGQKGWVRMPVEFRLIGPSKSMAARLRQSSKK